MGIKVSVCSVMGVRCACVGGVSCGSTTSVD